MGKISKATLTRNGVALFFTFGPYLTGCSLVATRPVQEMSDTLAAMKAAREVQADTNATEYYRLSEELYFKGKQEYRVKNFERANKLFIQARDAAEKAEFLSIRTGAARHSLISPDLPPPPPPPPVDSPPPPSTPQPPLPEPETPPQTEGSPAEVSPPPETAPAPENQALETPEPIPSPKAVKPRKSKTRPAPEDSIPTF
ncbi:MAG: hypothetical protein KGQ59_05760 [Bdellovibrionales bacterium]|nr:hypothetical protein [Bdellovibrionales bacterium]